MRFRSLGFRVVIGRNRRFSEVLPAARGGGFRLMFRRVSGIASWNVDLKASIHSISIPYTQKSPLYFPFLS